MSRLEELYQKMVDEAPVNFHHAQRAYIMELAGIYATESIKASLEKASEEAEIVPLQGKGFIDFSKQMISKESITNKSNIILL